VTDLQTPGLTAQQARPLRRLAERLAVGADDFLGEVLRADPAAPGAYAAPHQEPPAAGAERPGDQPVQPDPPRPAGRARRPPVAEVGPAAGDVLAQVVVVAALGHP